ncbi:MAG: hypothetical protein LBQ06_03770 [Frankiaceae bacterium]|jgi:hypothetical protein|nr:hypothetical protein [Frankiaceae bacterium]
MQVIIAAPLEGARARLANALKTVALPGIAVAGAEPGGAGTGVLGAVALFQWGAVLLDAADWPALETGARALRYALSSGGLQVLPPCVVRVLEPGDLPSASPEAGAVLDPDEQLFPAYGPAPRRAAALSSGHLSEVIIELARERYGTQQWSTADLLWTLDRLRLPRSAIEAISDEALVSLGFVSSRVPLLDGAPHPPQAQAAARPAPAAGSPAVASPVAGSSAVGPPIGSPSVALPAPGAASPAAAEMPPAPAPGFAAAAEAPTELIAAVIDLREPAEPVRPARRVPEQRWLQDPGPPRRRLVRYPAPDDRDDAPARRLPLLPIAAGAAVLVVIACLVIFLNIGGSGGGGPAALTDSAHSPGSAPSASPSPEPPASPESSTTPLSVPAGFTPRAIDAQTDCAGHSHGQVAQFFQTSPCSVLQRQLLTETADGHPAVFAVSDVTMPTAAAATSFKELIDTSGTGDINNLLADGATYPGAPASLPSNVAYASAINGAQVRIVEAAPTDGTVVGSAPGVQAAATALASAW